MIDLSLKEWDLIANITLTAREIDLLVKTNTDKLCPYFVLELKEKVADLYEKEHGACKDNAIAVNNMLFWCSLKAYGAGYASALMKYSETIKQEIINNVSKGRNRRNYVKHKQRRIHPNTRQYKRLQHGSHSLKGKMGGGIL